MVENRQRKVGKCLLFYISMRLRKRVLGAIFIHGPLVAIFELSIDPNFILIFIQYLLTHKSWLKCMQVSNHSDKVLM